MGFPWFMRKVFTLILSFLKMESAVVVGSETSNKNIFTQLNPEEPFSKVSASNPRPFLPSRRDLEDVFKKFDVNGDGKISWSEVGEVLRCFGSTATEEELQLMVKEGDINGDGFLDFSEFVELNTKDIDRESSLRDLEKAFDIFDLDGDGYISADELQRVFENLGEDFSLDECHRMIRGVDCDGDGSVNFQEFMIMMTASA